MISIRVVDVDFYMHCPIRDLDVFYSEFRCTAVRQVPIIEIFGSTPTGQKCCLHVHGVFPYIYIPYEGLEASDIQAYKIASELDKSINITLGQGTASTPHIHNIKLVSRIPAYGYHDKHHQFFKIYFYNPNVQKIACSLLEHGAVLGKSYQPHEAHINFILQFMIDYNLHGMSYINLQSAKYRDNPMNPIFREVIPAEQMLPASVERRSVCALEMDTNAINILNQDGSAVVVNPGLAALWEDEECRRRDKEMKTQISFSLTQERPDIKQTATHEMFSKKLEEMMLVMKSNDNSLSLNKSVYPAETPDDLNDTTLTQPSKLDTAADQRNATLNTPLSLYLNLNNSSQVHNSIFNSPLAPKDATSEEKSPPKVSDDDLENLFEDPPIENDSILSQTVIVIDDDDDDDEIQKLNTPLEEEDIWNDSFWDEDCHVPQLDGIHDGSDGLSSHEDEWEDVNIGDLPQQTTIFDRSFFNTIVCNNDRRKANDVFICNRNYEVIPAEKLLRPGVNKLITSEPSNQQNKEIKIISDLSITSYTNNNGLVSLNTSDSREIHVRLNSLNAAVSSLSITETDDWLAPTLYTEPELFEDNYFSDVILNDVNLADAQVSSFESINTTDEFAAEVDANKENIEYKPKKKQICANLECKTRRSNEETTSFYSDKTTYNHLRRRSMKVRCGFCSCAQAKIREQEYTFLSEEDSRITDVSPGKSTETIECNNNEIVPNLIEKTKNISTFGAKIKPDCSPITIVKSDDEYIVKNSHMKHWNLDGQGDTSSESNEDKTVIPKTNVKKVTRKKKTKQIVKQANDTLPKNRKCAKNLVVQLTKILNDSPDKENTVKTIEKFVDNLNKSLKVSPDNAKLNKTLRKSPTLPKVTKRVKQNRTVKTNIVVQPIPATLPKATKNVKQNRINKTNIVEQPIPATLPKVTKKKQNKTNIVEQPIPVTLPKVTKKKQNRTVTTNVEQPIPATLPKAPKKVKRIDKPNINEQLIPTTSEKSPTKGKNNSQLPKTVENAVPKKSPSFAIKQYSRRIYKELEVQRTTRARKSISKLPEDDDIVPAVLSKSSETIINKRQSKTGRRSEKSRVNQINNYRDKLILRRRMGVEKNKSLTTKKRPNSSEMIRPQKLAKIERNSDTKTIYKTRNRLLSSSPICTVTEIKSKLSPKLDKICNLNGTPEENESPKTNETSKQPEPKNKKRIQINDNEKSITRSDSRHSSTNSESPLSKIIINQTKTNETPSVLPEKYIKQDVSLVPNVLTGDQTKPNQLLDKQKNDLKAPVRLGITKMKVVGNQKWEQPTNQLQTDSYISKLSKIQLPDCKIVLTPIQFPSTWTPISSKTDVSMYGHQFTSNQNQSETEPTSSETNEQPTKTKSNSLRTLLQFNQNSLELLCSQNNSSIDSKASGSQTKEKISENKLIKPTVSEINPIIDSSDDNTFDSNNTKTIESDVTSSEKHDKNALGDTSKWQETEKPSEAQFKSPVKRSETKQISPKVVRKSPESTTVLPETPESYKTIDNHISPNRHTPEIKTENDARITRSHNRKSMHMYKINPTEIVISSASSSDDVAKSTPLKGCNNISPPKYSPLNVVVRSPREKTEKPLAEYEPLKKRLRSSCDSVDSPARNLSQLVQVPKEPKSYPNKGVGELQPFLPVQETVEEDVPVICDTPPNQMKSIINHKTIRKRLFDTDPNETFIEEAKICSFSSNNKLKTVNEPNSNKDELREVKHKEENFLNDVHSEVSRKPKLRKNKHKLDKYNNIKASIRKSKSNGLILNDFPVFPLRKTLSQQYDCALFDTSINFTKMDNLTIAEQYDLKRGFAPRAECSNYKIESDSSDTDSSTFDTTCLLKSSKKENIYTSSDSDTPKMQKALKMTNDVEKSLVDRSNCTQLSREFNLDSGNSSFNDYFSPNCPKNDIQLSCVQTSLFAYTISFNELDLGLNKLSETKTDDIKNVSSDLNETFANETQFDNSVFVSDFTFVEEENVISQEDINEIKSALEKSILEDEEIAASQRKPLIDTPTNNCKQIVLAPKYLPPTIQDVKAKLHLYNIPKHRYQPPYYSDYTDVTAKIDVGPNSLKISSNTIADLEEFITSSGFCGLNTWRRNKFMELYPHLAISKTNLRVFFAGNSELIMEPALFPPSRKRALDWVRTKTEQVQKTEKKLEKTRIYVPMSPGNDNDDSNDTLTLTPCTPPEQKLAQLTDATPTSTSPTLLREKGTRRRNLQRKVLKLSQSSAQTLNDSCANIAPGLSTSSDEQAQKLSTASTPTLSDSSVAQNLSEPSAQTLSDSHTNLAHGLSTSSKEQAQTLSDSSVARKRIAQKLSESSSLNNSCQITGVTLNNTHDFKMSYENLQHARAVTEVQNLTILVLELHIRTRAELYPDPQHDAIRAVFYSISNDVAADAELPRAETGVIVVDSLVGSPRAQQQSLLEGTGVHCVITYVQSEIELIDAVVKLIRKWDPDIFAGYEIEMLSWGYLIERSSVIGINLSPQLSRIKPEFLKPKPQHKNTQRNELKLAGRIVLDIWRLLKHEIALQSYTFENMMYHVLHQRVPKHSFKDLTFWWEYKTNFYRQNTANYYITRVEGVLKMLDQLDLINRTCELARLFGIQFYEVLSRGSQFRVESMMLRLAKQENYITISPSVQQRAKMRAPEYVPLIFEPESRFYKDPVIVLDFQSLYPSIIISHNYCYSTCVGRVSNLGSNEPFEFGAAQLKVLRSTLRELDGKINFSPCGVGFVNADVRIGILPRLLKEILETRLMVKASMKENKDNKLLQRVLHNRQLGLKLIANVTYGYTAANFSGRMPCVEVADSVVAKGRETLERAVKLIEETAKWGAKVVYGDTDSLFVLVEGRSREEAFKIGAEIAEAVTKDNPPPVKLKLEKVYQPCILQTKKRYVGYMYETPNQSEPVYNAKGIETVRRDGCPAVAKMLEKSLQILFDTQDVSLVKRYVVRQFNKLLTGRASIQDLIFAREYRGSSGYRPGACVPALELSKRWSSTDKRREPRQGERVPYIIVNGPPGLPLIRLVRCPRELLADPARLRPNAIYYITRAIIPPLNRCFSLIGADVQAWYCEMPRKQQQSLPTEIHQEMCKKSTISQYFATSSCAVCGDQTRNNLCERCATNSQQSVVVLQSKINNWERSHNDVYKICQSCCSRNEYIDCTSLDCPILYRKKQIERDLQQVPFVRNLLSKF